MYVFLIFFLLSQIILIIFPAEPNPYKEINIESIINDGIREEGRKVTLLNHNQSHSNPVYEDVYHSPEKLILKYFQRGGRFPPHQTPSQQS